MISYTCPKCGCDMTSPDSMAAKTEACPTCGGSVTVPAAESNGPTPTTRVDGQSAPRAELISAGSKRFSRRAVWCIGGGLAVVAILVVVAVLMMGSGDEFEVLHYRPAASQNTPGYTIVKVAVRGPVALVQTDGSKLVRLVAKDWHMLDSDGNILATSSVIRSEADGDRRTFNAEFEFKVKEGDTPHSIALREVRSVRLPALERLDVASDRKRSDRDPLALADSAPARKAPAEQMHTIGGSFGGKGYKFIVFVGPAPEKGEKSTAADKSEVWSQVVSDWPELKSLAKMNAGGNLQARNFQSRTLLPDETHTCVAPREDLRVSDKFQGNPIVRFKPGKMTTLTDLVTALGKPTHKELWNTKIAGWLGLQTMTYWWGKTAVAADRNGVITHVLIRFYSPELKQRI